MSLYVPAKIQAGHVPHLDQISISFFFDLRLSLSALSLDMVVRSSPTSPCSYLTYHAENISLTT